MLDSAKNRNLLPYQIGKTQGIPNVPWKIIFVRTYNDEKKGAPCRASKQLNETEISWQTHWSNLKSDIFSRVESERRLSGDNKKRRKTDFGDREGEEGTAREFPI